MVVFKGFFDSYGFQSTIHLLGDGVSLFYLFFYSYQWFSFGFFSDPVGGIHQGCPLAPLMHRGELIGFSFENLT